MARKARFSRPPGQIKISERSPAVGINAAINLQDFRHVPLATLDQTITTVVRPKVARETETAMAPYPLF
jgi:hypothetical protein